MKLNSISIKPDVNYQQIYAMKNYLQRLKFGEEKDLVKIPWLDRNMDEHMTGI